METDLPPHPHVPVPQAARLTACLQLSADINCLQASLTLDFTQFTVTLVMVVLDVKNTQLILHILLTLHTSTEHLTPEIRYVDNSSS